MNWYTFVWSLFAILWWGGVSASLSHIKCASFHPPLIWAWHTYCWSSNSQICGCVFIEAHSMSVIQEVGTSIVWFGTSILSQQEWWYCPVPSMQVNASLVISLSISELRSSWCSWHCTSDQNLCLHAVLSDAPNDGKCYCMMILLLLQISQVLLS